jgi:hypothetical protein
LQFFQVGNEPDAKEALEDLDDALSDRKGMRDMVDTVPFTGEGGAQLNANGIMKVSTPC